MSHIVDGQFKPEVFEPVYAQELLVPHISEERADTFTDVDPTKKYAGFCADDRQPTEASRQANLKEGFAEEYYRIFGGRYGLSKNTAVAIASVDPAILSKYGGTFLEFDEEVAGRVEQTSGVVFGKHSAEKNEDNPAYLHLGSCLCMGCLYATNIGKVGLLNFEDPDVDELARMEQKILFGDDDMLSSIKKGNEGFMTGFGLDEGFSINRDTAVADGSPVSILDGDHATIDDGVVVVQNYMVGKISNPGEAIKRGIPFYNNDLVAAGRMILNAFPELKIDPRKLLAVMDHDVRATRAALAGLEDKKVHEMPLQRYGNPDDAISYLMAA